MKNLKKNVMAVGAGTAGAIAAKAVANKLVPMLPVIGSNEYAKRAVPIALGIFLMDNKNSMIADLGFGMAVSAAGDFVQEKVPAIGAITGEDLESVAAQVIEGLDEQVDTILQMNDDMADDEMGDDEMGDDEMGDDEMGDDEMGDDEMGDDEMGDDEN